MAGDCYVYILYRADGVTPFYVGKGRGNRWLQHEMSPKRGRSYKDNIIAKMKAAEIVVPKKKIAEGLSDEEAYALEAETIAKIGRIFEGGPLTNRAAGGQGSTSPLPETRKRLAEAAREFHTGRKRSAEFCAKMRERQLGVKKGPRPVDERKARAEMERQAWREGRGRPDTFSMKGRKHSEETKAKMRAAALGRKMSPEARAKMSENSKRRKYSAETLAKRSISLKASWARRKAAAGGN